MSNEPLNQIKFQIEEILGTKTVLTKTKKTSLDKRKENFIEIINSVQTVHSRQQVLQNEFGIDFSPYDDIYFDIIDRFIALAFNANQTRLISFFLYQRINPDGSLNMIILPDGKELALQSPDELWEALKLFK